jgi:hypothetical protein
MTHLTVIVPLKLERCIVFSRIPQLQPTTTFCPDVLTASGSFLWARLTRTLLDPRDPLYML